MTGSACGCDMYVIALAEALEGDSEAEGEPCP